MSDIQVIGHGGGKGGGGGGGIQEDPDSLASIAVAKVIDLIGEGEIEGLVAGESSVYIDGVPLRNTNGTYNFERFAIETLNGTQFQGALPSFNTVEAETPVSTKVLSGSTGIVRTVSDAGADFVRVTLYTPSLSATDSTGHIYGTKIEFAIDVQSSVGAFTTVFEGKIEGKSRAGYSRSITLPLYGKQGTGPWNIRVRRITADSSSSLLQNDLYFSSFTVINSEKLRYPNSALIGLVLDARYFDHIPQRAYHVRGMKVRVPTNYDPVSRTYAITGPGTTGGGWDGTLNKLAYTNNPVWCFYDLMTSERYGLGDRIQQSQIDKWTLYRLSQYCDQMVPTGLTPEVVESNSSMTAVSDDGTARALATGLGSVSSLFKYNPQRYEPRFTLNCVLNTRDDAYKVLNNLASVFRGMLYWMGDSVQFSQDAPSDPVAIFSQANVIDGQFQYAGSAKGARHTVALVTWNDPSDNFKPHIEYVEDPDGIARYGINQTEIVAFGCTSRGQANRLGRWLLYTERMETEVVTFRTGLDAAYLRPGDVIQVADANVAGKRTGGRVVSSTLNSVTVDAPVTIEAGKTYKVSTVMPDGTIQSRTLTNAVGTTSTLTFLSPLPAQPQEESMWILAETNLVPRTFRVIGVKETGVAQYEISALEHNPSKYNAVELGMQLEAPIVTSYNPIPDPVSSVTAETVPYRVNNTEMSTRVSVSWPNTNAAKYVVRYREGSGNWLEVDTRVNSYDIDNVVQGTYAISVIAVGPQGLRSTPTTITHTVVIEDNAFSVSNLRTEYPFTTPDVSFVWDAYPGAVSYEVEVWTNGIKRVTDSVSEPKYVYTFEANKGFDGPFRAVQVKVRVITAVARSTVQQSLTATNSQIAAPTLSVLDTSGGLNITAIAPSDTDWYGTRVWVETTGSFDPLTTTPKQDGKNNALQIDGLAAGTYFVCAAHYDIFGPDSLNVSSKVQVTVSEKATGVPKLADPSTVTATPGSEPPGGDTMRAVYSSSNQKIWVWSKDQGKYIDTSNLQDGYFNLVAATKGVFGTLSAISTNAGNLTAGTFTLDSSGFIRGGSTGYMTGNGIWMGWHSGAYKIHVGNPTGAGFTWDGNTFTIRGAGGSVILASGTGVPFKAISDAPDDPQNLCAKSSFEDGSLGGWSGGGSIVPAYGQAFTQCMQLTARDTVLDRPFPVTPGERIYIDFMVHTAGTANNVGFGMAVKDAYGTVIDWAIMYSPPGHEWQPVSTSHVIPEGAAIAIPYAVNDAYANFGTPAIARLRLSRFQSGATVGAPSGTYVGGVEASTLASTAAAAKTAADAANQAIADFTNDNILTPSEAQATRLRTDEIWANYSTIDGQAAAYGLTAERSNHTNAFNNLSAVITPLDLGTLTTNKSVDGPLMRQRFTEYYAARQVVLDAVAAKASQMATWSGVSGSGKPEDNATVGATFGVNIGGKITPGNASTYIAPDSIASTFIANLHANKIQAGTITATQILSDAITQHSLTITDVPDAAVASVTTVAANSTIYMDYDGQVSLYASVFPYGNFSAGSRVDVSVVGTSSGSYSASVAGPLWAEGTPMLFPISGVVTCYAGNQYVTFTVTVKLTNVSPNSTGQLGARVTFNRFRKYR